MRSRNLGLGLGFDGVVVAVALVNSVTSNFRV